MEELLLLLPSPLKPEVPEPVGTLPSLVSVGDSPEESVESVGVLPEPSVGKEPSVG